MLRKSALWLGSALVLLATATAESQTQCKKCYDNPDGTAHSFGDLWWYGAFLGDCFAANSCHTNSQPGSCMSYHVGCGLAAAMLSERMNTSIARGDVVRVGVLIAANPRLVRFSPATGQVAVLDCDLKPLMTWNLHQARLGGAYASRGTRFTNPNNVRRVG
jgi:hypothetical protein